MHHIRRPGSKSRTLHLKICIAFKADMITDTSTLDSGVQRGGGGGANGATVPGIKRVKIQKLHFI